MQADLQQLVWPESCHKWAADKALKLDARTVELPHDHDDSSHWRQSSIVDCKVNARAALFTFAVACTAKNRGEPPEVGGHP